MQGLTHGEFNFEVDACAIAFNYYKSCINGVKLLWCVKWQLFWEEGNSPGSQKAGENAASVLPGEIPPADSAQPLRELLGLGIILSLRAEKPQILNPGLGPRPLGVPPGAGSPCDGVRM